MKVLVTGGGGTLGRELLKAATAAGYGVRATSRGAGTRRVLAGVEWARMDLATGDGLADALVGVDAVPVAYYRQKLAAEQALGESGVPFTIQRITQFHSFVDALLEKAARVPLVMPLPTDFKFQPIDEGEAAARLLECLAAGPQGRAPDFGGPEVLTLGDMADEWRHARRVRRWPVHVPIPGAAAAALRAGKNTAPSGARGVTRWSEWLARSSCEPEVAA
jgi:uncharacterized protein YbjT (DUF2867 family)